MRRIAALAVLLVGLAACHGSPTEPKTDDAVLGRLAGLVKIGPNCPAPATDTGCPTPPSAYAARKVLVYNEAGTQLLFTVDIDAQGAYLIALAPGKYLVDLKKVGIDRAAEVPTVVTIQKNLTTALNITVDTGLR